MWDSLGAVLYAGIKRPRLAGRPDPTGLAARTFRLHGTRRIGRRLQTENSIAPRLIQSRIIQHLEEIRIQFGSPVGWAPEVEDEMVKAALAMFGEKYFERDS